MHKRMQMRRRKTPMLTPTLECRQRYGDANVEGDANAEADASCGDEDAGMRCRDANSKHALTVTV